MCGQGKYTWANFRTYEGTYSASGDREGWGHETSRDGTSYIGEWKTGKYNGEGQLTLRNGNVASGVFENGHLKQRMKADMLLHPEFQRLNLEQL